MRICSLLFPFLLLLPAYTEDTTCIKVCQFNTEVDLWQSVTNKFWHFWLSAILHCFLATCQTPLAWSLGLRNVPPTHQEHSYKLKWEKRHTPPHPKKDRELGNYSIEIQLIYDVYITSKFQTRSYAWKLFLLATSSPEVRVRPHCGKLKGGEKIVKKKVRKSEKHLIMVFDECCCWIFDKNRSNCKCIFHYSHRVKKLLLQLQIDLI